MLERTRRFFRFLGLELDHIWHVISRVAVGCYNDGLIHAGNLAYMSMLAIFPFFVTGAAVFSAFGEDAERAAAVTAILAAMPPLVSDVIGPVARNVVELRSGSLLWIGGVVGLWTAGSLMETIRDILRRAYGTEPSRAFWWYRLFSTGFIILVMFLLMLALFVQVTIGATVQVISVYFPDLSHALDGLAWSRIIPMIGLFGSIYLVFYTLTPRIYRLGKSPKWPGALLVTIWWAIVSELLPRALRQVFSYDLTYGSLAGIMITLFFFWLVGLGLVAGAEFNAALANPLDKEAGGDSEANRDATKLEEIA